MVVRLSWLYKLFVTVCQGEKTVCEKIGEKTVVKKQSKKWAVWGNGKNLRG